MSILEQIADNIICGHVNANANYPPDRKGKPGVEELVKDALNQGISVQEILNKGLIAGMSVVGEKFKNNEYFVPEVLVSAKAMKSGMQIIKPKLTETGIQPKGTIIIGTVEGDMHDIGKNLVGMMLEGAGYQVVDLGVNVPSARFADEAKKFPKAVLGLSALLTLTMEKMKLTIDAIKAAGLSNPVIVGGAPVDQTFADSIGASGYAPDAASAVPLVENLIK